MPSTVVLEKKKQQEKLAYNLEGNKLPIFQPELKNLAQVS